MPNTNSKLLKILSGISLSYKWTAWIDFDLFIGHIRWVILDCKHILAKFRCKSLSEFSINMTSDLQNFKLCSFFISPDKELKDKFKY